MIAVAATLFAACSSNDTLKDVDTQDSVIGFGHGATEKATRAELDIDWFRNTSNVGFGVYGYKNDDPIFTNENVVCSNATSPYAWSHSTIRFWDKAVSDAYDFYAYAPFTGTNNTDGTNPTFNKTDGFEFTGINLIEDIETAGADKAIAAAVEDIDYADTRLCDAHSNSPTVQFVFNHILSKLSFKIKAHDDIKPADYTTASERVATFTVRSIKIDFPSDNNVTWTENGSNDITGYTTYSNSYAAKTGTKADAAFETTVFTGPAHGETDAFDVTNTFEPIGATFIVAPVNTTYPKHEFDIQVEYDILYADGTNETGCKATGTIGTGDPDATVNVPGSQTYDANIYAPAQNQYYVANIIINPDRIEFCVEDVEDWDPNGDDLEPVEVN